MRSVLAIIFLVIFTFQVMPLRALGKLLGATQSMAEEVDDDTEENSNDGKVFKYGEDQLVSPGYVLEVSTDELRGFNCKIAAFIHKEEALPPVFVAERLFPPPNC